MSRREDHFTSTVDGAATFERAHAEPCEDKPERHELERNELERDERDWFDDGQAIFSDGMPSGEPLEADRD